MTALDRLWQATDALLAECPRPMRRYRVQGQRWLTMLCEQSETHIPQGCPEVAAHTMLKLEQQLRKHMTVTYQRPVCSCGRIHNEEAHGCYSLTTNTLFVEPDDPRRMFSTMLHETAHAVMCQTDVIHQIDRDVQEIIAEATSCEVLGRFGIDSVPQAAAYIAAYAVKAKENPRALTGVVRALADKIERLIDE